LRSIMRGLERNGLLSDVGHLLTGYIGSASFLEAVMDVLQMVRRHSKGKLRYVCDPVLGDVGSGFYVPQELVKLFREQVIPQADIITPNQFEAEQLTEMTIASVENVKTVCNALHEMGPPIVFITSVMLESEEKNIISVFASRRTSAAATATTTATTQQHMWRITCPQLPGQYTGTGDLFSSLLLGHSALEPDDLPAALDKVMNTMYAIIQRTLELTPDSALHSKYPIELRLIQCKDIIENPPLECKTEVIQ